MKKRGPETREVVVSEPCRCIVNPSKIKKGGLDGKNVTSGMEASTD